MAVAVRSRNLALAAVLLADGCSGKGKIAYKELADPDPVVRSDAALRLGEARAREAVGSLIAVLDDPDETVRVNVIRALGQIGDTTATTAVAPYVSDKLESVRMASCQALGMLKDPRGVPLLEKALYDEDGA